MKKQSFISGAFLLALATGLGKIFSAIFKIPLDRFFLHADGMAIFNTSYNIYMFFFAIATAGIPMAISAMIAKSKSQEEETAVLSTVFISLQAVMTVIFLVLFICSDSIACALGLPEAGFALKVMSPALLFVAFTASLRGFFQGKLYMSPSALSQLSDSFGRFAFGFTLVALTCSLPLSTCAGSALTGVPLGALLSAVVLVTFFIKTKPSFRFSFSKKVLWRIVCLSLPITLTASLHAIFNMVDTISVVSSLTYFNFPQARNAFGCLSRSATLYALPCSIAGAISQSVLPSVSDSFKEDNLNRLNSDCSMAIRLSLLFSIPCMAGFMAISGKILNFLYDSWEHHTTLILIAPSAVLLSVASTQCAILQGMGKTKYSFIGAIIAVCTKAVLNPFLISILGVNGAALSSSVAYLVLVLLLMYFTHRETPIRYKSLDVFVKPLICGVLCFIAATLFKNFPAFVTIVITATIYIPSVLLTKFISKDEVVQIFTG